jgi:DNA repair protein RecO (recombination protein O)
MLQELGYALTLNHDVASGKPIDPDREYSYEIERGPLPHGKPAHGLAILGKTLLDMERGDYSDPLTRQQSKTLMRYILNYYLGDQPLYTRQLLKELHQL